MSFSTKLKALREAAGLTQGQLAEQTGLSKGGIADLEQGKNVPSWATVEKLCTFFKVSCEVFRSTDGEQPEPPPAPRGRPKKPATDEEKKPAEKRPRGRPKKGPGA